MGPRSFGPGRMGGCVVFASAGAVTEGDDPRGAWQFPVRHPGAGRSCESRGRGRWKGSTRGDVRVLPGRELSWRT
eukprot:4380255-Pyramimonas_sp.AAC.1